MDEKPKKPITRKGFERLAAEHDQLLLEERPKVVKGVQTAAAEGDRSENAEYIYGKKQLREIDARVRFLAKRLDEVTVVDKAPRERDRVFFGALVTLEDDTGRSFRYRLVGPDEFDSAPEYISIDSPMARALLKKQRDDEISIPQGDRINVYTITDIVY